MKADKTSNYVYFYDNKINGKMYLGEGAGNRYKKHISIAKYIGERYKAGKDEGEKYKGEVGHLHRAISKYGIENFEYGIFEYYGSEEEAYLAERYWIAYLRSQGIVLYNIAEGGYGGQSGIKRTPETCAKISKARKGITQINKGRPLEPEHALAISDASFGKPGTNKDKTFSDMELQFIKKYGWNRTTTRAKILKRNRRKNLLFI